MNARLLVLSKWNFIVASHFPKDTQGSRGEERKVRAGIVKKRERKISFHLN